MDGSEWVKGGPGYERSVMMMDGEIRGYRKECFVKQLLSSVLVAVVGCTQARVKSSMEMMQDRDSPWMATRVLRKEVHW